MAGGSNAELRDRVQRIEELLAALGANPPPEVAIEALSLKFDAMNTELQNVRRVSKNHIRESNEKMDAAGAELKSLTDDLHVQFGKIDEEVGLLKKAVLSTGSKDSGISSKKYKIPEPKAFAGARSAKELENFIYDMKQYFKAAHVSEDEQVAVTTMYLCDDAKLWWRTRSEDKSRVVISSWSGLIKELREQFLPANSGWQAREALRRVKHDKTVREYVKEFTSLMLDIKGMSDEDKVFNFVVNLQPWAQAELRRQGVKDFQQAVAAADSLVDLRLDKSDSTPGKAKKQDKGGSGDAGNDGETEKDKGKKVDEQSNKGRSGFSGCFICKGPQRARDCTMKEKLNALQVETSGEDARVNPLVLLGGLQVESSGKK